MHELTQTITMTDRQYMQPVYQDKPDITDALNWLASHSGEYSVVILEHIEQLTTKVDGFNSWLNRLDKLCNEPYVEMPTGMTREERHSWAKQAQQNVSTE